MGKMLCILGLVALIALPAGRAEPAAQDAHRYCPVLYDEPSNDCLPLPESFLDFLTKAPETPPVESHVLDDLVEALAVLQAEYFQPDYATWPAAIDWTGAVAGTVIAGTLTSLTKSLAAVDLNSLDDWKAKENLISSFYAQLVGSYFGQDVLSIRGQAYDDILWVVLEWVEAIRFVNIHSDLHYSLPEKGAGKTGLKSIIESTPWQGQNWFSSFAHRARIFWNLGSHGWDTKLCGGGMIWNPRLNPYKNAITNELWIAASISMYRHFPGDNFTAPWLANAVFPGSDPAHLEAAVDGYKWLKNINLKNQKGLYVDGYHINRNKPGNTKCDLRDEMVYTYNQGVVLTGQRGLWTITGSPSYLKDGHDLIQSVIAATGWDLKTNNPSDDLSKVPRGWLPPWRGLGRGGIMEEQCDATGTCSQDGQTFKGVFFHHLAGFCAPLDPIIADKGLNVDLSGYRRIASAHAAACVSYLGWLRHNAMAALATRDNTGRFGMWWGAGIFDAIVTLDNDGIDHNAENTTDYRNQGTPEDDTWGEKHRWVPGSRPWTVLETNAGQHSLTSESQKVLGESESMRRSPGRLRQKGQRDPNVRGRGRTVETQVGGLALLKAYWDMSQSYS